MHLISAERNYSGTVHQLYPALLKVMEQMSSVCRAYALHEIGHHFYDGHVSAIFVFQPVSGFTSDHASSDDNDLLSVSHESGIIQEINAEDPVDLIEPLKRRDDFTGSVGAYDGVVISCFEKVRINVCIQFQG